MENIRLFLTKWSSAISTILALVCIAALLTGLGYWYCILLTACPSPGDDEKITTTAGSTGPGPGADKPGVCDNGAVIGIFRDLYLLCRPVDTLRPKLSDFAKNPRVLTAGEALTCGTNLRPLKVSEEYRSDFTGLLRNVGLKPIQLSESDVGDAQRANHIISKLITDHIAAGHNYYALLVDHYYYGNHQAVVAEAIQLAASSSSGDHPGLAESKLFVIDTDLLGSRFPEIGGAISVDAYDRVDDSTVIALVALPCLLEANYL